MANCGRVLSGDITFDINSVESETLGLYIVRTHGTEHVSLVSSAQNLLMYLPFEFFFLLQLILKSVVFSNLL